MNIYKIKKITHHVITNYTIYIRLFTFESNASVFLSQN